MADTLTTTENGAVALTAAGVAAPLLAKSQRGGALVVLSGTLVGPRGSRPSKGTSDTLMHTLVANALDEGKTIDQFTPQLVDLVIMLFNLLDILDGRGERALFVAMYKELYLQAPAAQPLLLELLQFVPHYGCWRTLATLYTEAGAETFINGAAVQTRIVALWAQALVQDWDKVVKDGAKAHGLSQAGKWAPSLQGAVNTQSGLGDAIVDQLALAAPRIMNPNGGVAAIDVALAAATVDDDGSTQTSPPKPAVSEAKRRLALYNARAMQYRRLLSRLRAALDVPEVKMAARQWADVDPTKVPSLANNKYKNALQNVIGKGKAHARTKEDAGVRGGIDLVKAAGAAMPFSRRAILTSHKRQRTDEPDRVQCAQNYASSIVVSLAAARAALKAETETDETLTTVTRTKKPRVIKGARNQAHELVDAYMSVYGEDADCIPAEEEDPLVEAMWADLVTQLRAKGVFKPAVSIVDVSGSMNGLPIVVAIALGILLSQLQPQHSPFYKKLLTFSAVPEWVDISGCDTLFAAVAKVRAAPWGMNTNFAAAMKLVLDQARAANMVGEAVPAQLFVFSDMQFDDAANNAYEVARTKMQQTIFGLNGGEDVRAAYSRAGLRPPQIIYWNLRATVPAFQANAGMPGVALVSGFSQEVLRQFLDGGDIAAAVPPAPSAEEVAAADAEAVKVAAEAAATAKAEADAAAWEQLAKVLAASRYDRVREAAARLLPIV